VKEKEKGELQQSVASSLSVSMQHVSPQEGIGARRGVELLHPQSSSDFP
jgi:hypothetical protein